MTQSTPPPTLVISLDFELYWGVRDHCAPGSAYEANLRGAREVIPRLLELFAESGIAATWATVGLLFARSASDRETWKPSVLPTYERTELYPYGHPVGPDEDSDPLHYAGSLIERILTTPRQELATHTYSHYYCAEAGQTAEQFDADLRAAHSAARAWGVTLESIVFPRNQHNPAYDDVLRRNGIRAYRGNPASWLWRFEGQDGGARAPKRAARLLDAYIPLTGDGSVGWDELACDDTLADVRASFFIRPYSRSLAALESVRLRRITRAMRSAAKRGRILHLWWHPHNFGTNSEESLSFLRSILTEFSYCRERFGMQSLTMREVAGMALGIADRNTAGPALSSDSPVRDGGGVEAA